LKARLDVVILPNASTLMGMKSKVLETKGIDVADSMYKIGKSAGNDLGRFIKGFKSRKSKVKKVLEILNLADYGIYELRGMTEKSALIKLTKSPFVKLCFQNKESSCYWISGFLSGLFSNVSKGWTFKKSKCKIEDCSHCEFIGMIK
jgi:predicted hydrocarbon binding protein